MCTEYSSNYSNSLIFFVNGRKIVDDQIDPEWTLLYYLRKKLYITGTKLGCGEGGCGACTVMVSRYNDESQTVQNYSVNACLCLVASLHGAAVVTVEGIGSTDAKLHPVQERIAKSHGSQCGFCTPGFVMSMYTLLRNKPDPTMEEIEENLAGNLCRCTGYRPILDGFYTFAKDAVKTNGCGLENCCQLQNNDQSPSNIQEGLSKVLYDPGSFMQYDPTQDIIFPPELKKMSYLDNERLCFDGPRVKYFRPTTLDELLSLKKIYPNAKLSAGNTEIGVEMKFKNQHYPVIINPNHVSDLQKIKISDMKLIIGSCTTLSELEHFLVHSAKELADHHKRIPEAIQEMLKWFAGRQIRNVATIGGNIVTGSPISDLIPILMAAGSVLHVKNTDGTRLVSLDRNFFIGYRKHTIKPEEILISISVPLTDEDTYFYAFKQSRRKEDDIAIVNAGMQVSFLKNSVCISSITLAFGGMAPFTILAQNTMEKLKGLDWNQSTTEVAIATLMDELSLNPSAPGGMVQYRCTLAASFFMKFFLLVQKDLQKKFPNLYYDDYNFQEITAKSSYIPPKSFQLYQKVPPNQDIKDPIGRPHVHLSAHKQASGEAVYVDDIPSYLNESHGALVTSKRAKAKILNIDATKALEVSGVELFLCAKDLSGQENVINLFCKEETFASNEVVCVGQVIGIVLAKDQATAQRGAKLVEVTYGDAGKPVLTIEDALEAKTTMEPISTYQGDVDSTFTKCDHVLEGIARTGGQEHFYMETFGCLAVPHEGGEMEILSSTQSPGHIQMLVAYALGVPANHVVSKVKRIGGGFGGKETRPVLVALPAAIAAKRLKKPVRLMLDRDEDMQISGGRNPTFAKWKVGFDSNGRIHALEVNSYCNVGHSDDISQGVVYRIVFSISNGYHIPNIRITGTGCLTNLPSNTAFRGFGSPQSGFIMENVVDSVAAYLKIDHRKLRELNLPPSGSVITNFGQPMEGCTVRQCWNDVIKQSNYEARQAEIIRFNKNCRYRKKGIAIVPCLFCVGFGVLQMNCGGALVNVYQDGSVLVSIGGIEMGQGLYTKVMQVASRVLKIPIEMVHIMETASDKVPNSQPTAASLSSDLYGMATLNACTEIYKQLEPFREKDPTGSWQDWVTYAINERVSLSATGYYKVPNLKAYDFEKHEGSPFGYFTYGSAVSEVEIDCLTGDHTVLRTDIVMDVGESLNPAIDVGQIEGAFAQGLGLFTIEELLYSPDGHLMTKGPGAYKIPSVSDIPREFNVTLLRGSSNPRAVYSSKAVGEPPLFLGASVFFAIKDAIRSARGPEKDQLFKFNAPATAEKIRLACTDFITSQNKTAEPGTFKPWAINV